MKTRNKCKFNHNFFSDINTENKAYWLGFLMADGCIIDKVKSGSLQLSIRLSKRDLTHLKKFHEDIDSLNKIGFGKHNDIYSSHSSDILCNDLIKLGCTPRKSLTLMFPQTIPDDLMNHFIRGYFDGDGSTSIHKGRFFADFLGTKWFLEELNEKLPIKRNVRVKKENLFILQFSDIDGCKTIYSFMYNNATIFLDRKKNKFEEWIKIEKKGSGNYDHKNQRREVIQKDKNNNIIKIWPSLKSAADELGINCGWISNVCQKREKSAKGFIWEYNN
jgi:hypothetical protein